MRVSGSMAALGGVSGTDSYVYIGVSEVGGKIASAVVGGVGWAHLSLYEKSPCEVVVVGVATREYLLGICSM